VEWSKAPEPRAARRSSAAKDAARMDVFFTVFLFFASFERGERLSPGLGRMLAHSQPKRLPRHPFLLFICFGGEATIRVG
jgi:hypothetical protein